MRPIDRLLEFLHNVRKSGNGWRADCPNGHTRARGSLALAEADDGRVLATCHACHDMPGILAAIGLDLTDLFPERIADPSPEARRTARAAFQHSGWEAALGVLAREATIVGIAARELAKDCALPQDDHTRLLLAIERIESAKGVLHGR